MFRYHPIVWLVLGSLTVSKNDIFISRAESNFIIVVVFRSFSCFSVLKDITIHSRESVCLENQIVGKRNMLTVNMSLLANIVQGLAWYIFRGNK